jgi:enamine deaminase RidA (YjgF/YER057c/UK114 family)
VSPEEILGELGLVLPAAVPPAADYVKCRVSGTVLYISGHGPMRDGQAVFTGKVGIDLDVEDGAASAELAMLNILTSVKASLGSLDRIRGFVRLSIFVNAAPDFKLHHLVANGASNLVTRLYGAEAGHARCAVGVASLPFDIATEIEAVVGAHVIEQGCCSRN